LQWLRFVPYFVGVNCGPSLFRGLLERAGFEVVEMSAALHFPRVAAVPFSRIVRRHASQPHKEGFLGLLMWFEKLANGPFRFVTGHDLTIKAIRA
jgi:hypothetical protein